MIARNWRKLGRRLHISNTVLEEIDEAHADLSEKGYYMLLHWKETGSAATYKVLSDALQHEYVHRRDLAEKYCYMIGNHFHDILMCMYSVLMVRLHLQYTSDHAA